MHKVSFLLANTDNGVLIVNRNDVALNPSGTPFGVGAQVLETGEYDVDEINMLCRVLDFRRHYYGAGATVLDVGANIGIHTLAFARVMRGWGTVVAFEPQGPLYYALCGNIVLANLHRTVRAHCIALGAESGHVGVPLFDYDEPASFGSLALEKRDDIAIGQDTDSLPRILVEQSCLDDECVRRVRRVDLIKIDVEGMELDVLRGGEKCIRKYRPVLFVEHLRCDKTALDEWLGQMGYEVFTAGINTLAVHASDKCLAHVKPVEEEK